MKVVKQSWMSSKDRIPSVAMQPSSCWVNLWDLLSPCEGTSWHVVARWLEYLKSLSMISSSVYSMSTPGTTLAHLHGQHEVALGSIEQALRLPCPGPVRVQMPNAVGVDEAQQDLEHIRSHIIHLDARQLLLLTPCLLLCMGPHGPNITALPLLLCPAWCAADTLLLMQAQAAQFVMQLGRMGAGVRIAGCLIL